MRLITVIVYYSIEIIASVKNVGEGRILSCQERALSVKKMIKEIDWDRTNSLKIEIVSISTEMGREIKVMHNFDYHECVEEGDGEEFCKSQVSDIK